VVGSGDGVAIPARVLRLRHGTTVYAKLSGARSGPPPGPWEGQSYKGKAGLTACARNT
jgi:hypothetical protein